MIILRVILLKNQFSFILTLYFEMISLLSFMARVNQFLKRCVLSKFYI